MQKKIIRSARFILASTSPRRIEIIKKVSPDFKFDIIDPDFKENLPKRAFSPEQYVSANAKMKSYDVCSRIKSDGRKDQIVIAADTIIVGPSGKMILEKPIDAEHARFMLSSLSDRVCKVLTGVCIVTFRDDFKKDAIIEHFVETTTIQFASLTKDIIEAYVKTGEPLDKAGSIGYQGYGASLIRKIDGCYYNVVGFPLSKVCEYVNQMFNNENKIVDDAETKKTNRVLFFEEVKRLSSLNGSSQD